MLTNHNELLKPYARLVYEDHIPLVSDPSHLKFWASSLLDKTFKPPFSKALLKAKKMMRVQGLL